MLRRARRRAVGVGVLALAVIGPTPAAAGGQEPTVVASFYPLAWLAGEVAGPGASVRDLVPVGAEPHDRELGFDDRDAIETADLVIVLGGGFQPAIEDAAAQRDGPTLELVDELPGRLARRARKDPHLWLDPVVMAGPVLEVVSRALRRIDVPTDGADAVRRELEALHRDHGDVAECPRDLLVTAHDAFGWLARRYELRQEGIAGVDPENEPSPARLAELADLVEEEGVTTIFTEELVSADVARTLAREAGGVRVATLSPLESLTEQQQRRGDDYVDVMRRNLARIRTALCEPA